MVKNRKLILVFGVFSLVANGISYVFLSAWSGLAMCILALVRDIVFLIQDKYSNNRDKITWIDWVILIVLYIIAGVSAVFTFDGFWSLMSVFATCLFTLSVWQKSPKVYRFLGCIVSVFWIIYNIFIWSPFGLVLECVLLVFEIVGTVKAYLKSEKDTSMVEQENKNKL